MTRAVLVAFAGVALCACGSLDRSARTAPLETTSAGGAAAVGAATAPVVLELFTSQGCSSCPPADRLLSKLAEDPRYRGRIVPLAFHVDYWDYIGWRDPFSSKEWTDRQNAYARAMGLEGVYTPQLVINGHVEAVGSNEGAVTSDIESASSDPAATVHARAELEGTQRVNVHVEVSASDQLGITDATLVVALFESGVETRVQRGENAGRVLANDFIVRRFEEIPSVPLGSRAAASHTVAIDIDPAWNRANLGVATFLQDKSTMRIYGAAVVTRASGQ